jgi:hypothetical protein
MIQAKLSRRDSLRNIAIALIESLSAIPMPTTT